MDKGNGNRQKDKDEEELKKGRVKERQSVKDDVDEKKEKRIRKLAKRKK